MSKLALVGLSLGLAILSAPSVAQQGAGSSPGTAAAPAKQNNKPANPAARRPVKPAATAQGGAVLPADTMRLPQSNSWSIYDALPTQSRAVRDPVPERTPLSRVPLEGGAGTVGFDSFSAGRSVSVPGQEVYSQRDSSYAGMSLSVPSLNKALPTLLPPPTGRSEW